MLQELGYIFRNNNFRYLWFSQILSQLTIHIINFLLLIRLFNETGSTIATAFLWVAYAIPAILFGPIAAASADMVDRKKMLVYTNFLQSLVILLYAITHSHSVFLLYGAVIAYSLLNQFYIPAEVASLPSMVSKKNLAQANGMFFITQQAALIAGFGLAGILLNAFGFAYSLYTCSFLLFLAFMSVKMLPAINPQAGRSKSFEDLFFKFFKRIYAGYEFIKGNRIILAPFMLLLGMQVLLSVVAINTPVIAQEIFKIDIELIGMYLVVPAGVGTAVGSVVIPRLIRKGYRKIKIIEYSLFYITISLFLITFLVPALSFFAALILGFVILFMLGVSFIGISISSQTFLQEKTPGGLRGRVFGNFWFLVAIASLFPVIISGTVVEILGGKFLTLSLSAIALATSLFIKRWGESFLQKNVDFTKRGRYRQAIR